MLSGDYVFIYKTIKANGENVQISFNEKINYWIISSKNVALLARNENDLNAYLFN